MQDSQFLLCHWIYQAVDLEVSVGRLALQNYRVFIANHDCVRAVRSQSRVFNDSTVTLRSELSAFSEQTNNFKTVAEHIIASHRRNRSTLQQHMQILDLLELPQLMDACVRNGLNDSVRADTESKAS